MATVSNSAASSATQVLAAVGSAASVITQTFNSVGDAANVMGVNTRAWLRQTRKRDLAMQEDENVLIAQEVSASISQRMRETSKLLERDPELKALYVQTYDKVYGKLAALDSEG